jgi:hypothetical protein
MNRARLIAVVLLSTTLGVAGCGGSSGGGGSPATKTIKLSGTLSAGSVASALTSGTSALSVSSPLTALAGYKLYCVTFSAPPVSGSAAADTSGLVSLTLAAQNVPIGCFVLDAADKNVATLLFKFGAQKDQTVIFGADTDLGAITVDTTNGVAQTVPSGGTLVAATPPGLQCPVGKWVSDVFDAGTDSGPPPVTCNNATVVQIAVLKPDGSLMVSHGAFGVVVKANSDPSSSLRVCGEMAFPAELLTLSNNTLTASFIVEPDTCPAKTVFATATFDAACTVETMHMRSVGCGDCAFASPGNDGCHGCGSVTCSTTTTPGASALILHKK